MDMKALLNQFEMGSSVAEFDGELEQYFVETPTFRALLENKADVIAGDKGTGKTALFKILQKRYAQLPALAKVEIIPGFNPAGNPVFQKLAQTQPVKESNYTTIWKAYILSLVGNWLLSLYEGSFTTKMTELDGLLKKLNIRSADDSASTIFSKITNTFSRLLNPKSAQGELTFQESGIPIIKGKVEFGEAVAANDPSVTTVSHESALSLLNGALAEADLSVWVVLDRLDEAFQGFPETETPALRALFRTYLDLREFDRLGLKLFVRKDLFRKIIQGGFVNLTHINARKAEIVWEEEDLLNLLCQRIKRNRKFIEALKLGEADNKQIFGGVFPEQVDVGKRKSGTWSWVMARIRDGNNVKPPRNLIDLISMARDAQVRKEGREPRQVEPGTPVIEGDSLRRALSSLSEMRVQDTLLAEAGAAAPIVEKFREGKAEHNEESLARLLGVQGSQVKAIIKPLVELGFIEELKDTYKVPMLYRDGLAITQGKAFSSGVADDED
jgi:hypothetical protein